MHLKETCLLFCNLMEIFEKAQSAELDLATTNGSEVTSLRAEAASSVQ